jgi:hypothetical protein
MYMYFGRIFIKIDATREMPTSTRKGSTRKGSTRKGSTRKGSTRKGSEPSTRWLTVGRPDCNVAAFQIKTQAAAAECGRFRGGVYARWVGVLIVGVAAVAVASTYADLGLRGALGILAAAAAGIGACFAALPAAMGYFASAEWQTARAKMGAFKASGMSQKDIMKRMQAETIQEMQNQGMMRAAEIMRAPR